MDLHRKGVAARNAVIWILNCIGIVVLLWATDSYGLSETGPDYLSPDEVKGGYIERTLRLQSADGPHNKQAASSVVNYMAFDSQSHALVEHRGRHVSVLLPENPPSSGSFFTADHVAELIDRLDIQYALYRELLKVEPRGSGLLKVAFVSETCGMGCGLIGAKGIEIKSDSVNYESIARELDAGRLERVLVHELAHNFDRYSNWLHYLPDHAHAWTDIFEFFAPYRYGRDSANGQAPEDAYNSPVRSVWKSYVSRPEADWELCVRDQACEASGLSANNLWAMLYYRIDAVHGTQALIDSFHFLADHIKNHPAPTGDEEREGLRILSLAVGVGANISCYMDSLKWPVPSSARSEMEKRFGYSSSFCADLDLDGFNAINGDCDDYNASRNILGTEIPGNSKDDDCDELVDEDSLIEAEAGLQSDNFRSVVSTRLPFEVEGSVSSDSDHDTFQFGLTESKRARVTLCADESFRGWAVGLQPAGDFLETPAWNIYRPFAGCSSQAFDYTPFEDGGVLVMSDDAPGNYSLTVSEAASLPADHSVYLSVVPRSSGGVTLQVEDRDGYFAGLGADEVEVWISGAGVQMYRSFTSNMTIQLNASSVPGLVDGELYQVRLRPRANKLPLAAFSAGHLFRYRSGPVSVPTVDSGFSGLWYDPEHNGEGFIVEILDSATALVYWFTYHGDGSQRWFIGVGDVKENRVVVEEFLDTHGGRFSSTKNPTDVVRTDRGRLAITFNNCDEAMVNFSIDGFGGNMPVQRLTPVFGHGCGVADQAPELDISGSWYDPGHDGEGFVVQQYSPVEALVFYFTYDDAGKQAWLFNTGQVEGSVLTFPDILRPTGGGFGRSYDPAGVDLQPWGELTLDLDCGQGPVNYASSLSGFGNGSQQLRRLTRLQNSGCF
jgi:hypothetical protein